MDWLDHLLEYSAVQSSSVIQSCPTLCDPMNRSMPGLLVHHQLLEFTQTQVPDGQVLENNKILHFMIKKENEDSSVQFSSSGVSDSL